jgi:hypothetical protein
LRKEEIVAIIIGDGEFDPRSGAGQRGRKERSEKPNQILLDPTRLQPQIESQFFLFFRSQPVEKSRFGQTNATK